MAFSSVRSHSADYHSRSAHKADKEFLDIDIIIGLEIEADAFPAHGAGDGGANLRSPPEKSDFILP